MAQRNQDRWGWGGHTTTTQSSTQAHGPYLSTKSSFFMRKEVQPVITLGQTRHVDVVQSFQCGSTVRFVRLQHFNNHTESTEIHEYQQNVSIFHWTVFNSVMWLVGNLTKPLDQLFVTYVHNWLWVMLPLMLRLRCEHHHTMLPAIMYQASASKFSHFHLTYASPFLKPFMTYHGQKKTMTAM